MGVAAKMFIQGLHVSFVHSLARAARFSRVWICMRIAQLELRAMVDGAGDWYGGLYRGEGGERVYVPVVPGGVTLPHRC